MVSMRTKIPGSGALAALLALFAGALPGACVPEAGPALTGGPAFRWSAEAESGDNPLPDERLQDARGALDLARRDRFFLPYLPAGAATHEAEALFNGYAEDLLGLEGWGTYAPVYAQVDAELDEASLDAALFHLVRLDADGPRVDVTPKWHADPGYLEVEPLVPLAGGARYALVVQRGPTAGGEVMTRSEAWHAWVTEEGAAALTEAAGAAGLAEEEVIFFFTWRTDPSTRELTEAVEAVMDHVPAFDTDPEPGRVRGIIERPEFATLLPDREDDLAAAGRVIIGAIDSLNLRQDKLLDPARIRGEVAPDHERLEVVIVEPDAERFPPPWPAVILQHGFGSSDEFVMQNAYEFVDAGYAVLGIDAVSHGTRGSIVQFLNVEDVRVMRDNFRQTVLDLVQLATFAREGGLDVDGVPGPDLDGSVRYFGHSMGSILGIVVTSLMPEAPHAVLSAPGGGIGNILQSENLLARIELLILPALGLGFQDPAYELSIPFLTGFVQALLDRGDPINFAPHMFEDRPAHTTGIPSLLLQQGNGDRMVPNNATEDLARALAVPILDEPVQADEPTSGVWPLEPSAYGMSPETDPHDVYFHVAGLRRQAVEYLKSDGRVILAP